MNANIGNEISIIIMRVVLSAMLCFLTKTLIPCIKQWYQNVVDEKMRKAIREAVESAEQTFRQTGAGKIKKEDVVSYMSTWLKTHNIDISERELDVIIESTVFALNNSKKEKN